MLSISTNVTLKEDTRVWEKMKRNLKQGANKTVDIGWWGTRHPTGVSTAQVAAWNEEGHMNGGMFAGTRTPPRPFIRTIFMPVVYKKLPSMVRKNFHAIAMGRKSWASFNNELGIMFKMEMQKTILNFSSPPNSPVTVELKGFNDPLIGATGNMYDSVKYRIVNLRRS